MPTLRVIETDGMNAFASGLHEGRFSVTVTRGLLQATGPTTSWRRCWATS